eukprot:TRINITY_DN140_c0_g1_i5.p2 TRINITY_DN140_c0_g1~~TRINITY_DN140_c0_g1_i5.p2  ORF type:complete len:179 (-),score=1.67 TRINITY_DN140_c0_g1_i5:415-951(-)
MHKHNSLLPQRIIATQPLRQLMQRTYQESVKAEDQPVWVTRRRRSLPRKYSKPVSKYEYTEEDKAMGRRSAKFLRRKRFHRAEELDIVCGLFWKQAFQPFNLIKLFYECFITCTVNKSVQTCVKLQLLLHINTILIFENWVLVFATFDVVKFSLARVICIFSRAVPCCNHYVISKRNC